MSWPRKKLARLFRWAYLKLAKINNLPREVSIQNIVSETVRVRELWATQLLDGQESPQTLDFIRKNLRRRLGECLDDRTTEELIETMPGNTKRIALKVKVLENIGTR